MRQYIDENPDLDVPFWHLFNMANPGYYTNGKKHFSELLSRMVKQNYILRTKHGRYNFPKQANVTQEEINFGLFNNTQP